MDAYRHFSMSTNEEKRKSLVQKLFDETKPVDTSNNIIDKFPNCNLNLNILHKHVEEKVPYNLLSFSNDSSHNLFKNELVVNKDKESNKKSLVSINWVQTELEVPIKSFTNESTGCDNLAKLNMTLVNIHSNMKPYHSNEEITSAVASALKYSPTLIRYLANAYQNNDNSRSHNNKFLNLGLNEKLCFDCYNMNTATLQSSNQILLSLFNLRDSLVNSQNKLVSAFENLENSMEIVEDVLYPHNDNCTSSETQITFEELIEQILIHQNHMNKDMFEEHIRCNQLVTVQKVVDYVTEKCMQNSDLDLTAKKYTLSAESVLECFSRLFLVNPEVFIDIKEKPFTSTNQINNVGFQYFEGLNEVEFADSAKFVSVQQSTLPNNVKLAFECSKPNSSTLFKENFSKQFCKDSNKLNLKRVICNGSSFTYKNFFNHQVGENLSHKKSAQNSQSFFKKISLLSDNPIANTNARKGNSIINLSVDVEINKTAMAASQDEIKKLLDDSYKIQLLSCKVTDNLSNNHADFYENVSSQTFKPKLSSEFKPLCHTLSELRTTSFPQIAGVESHLRNMGSDCAMKSCSRSVDNHVQVQFPPIPGTIESTIVTKPISRIKKHFYLQSLFKRVDTFEANSLAKFELIENMCKTTSSEGKNSIRNTIKCTTSSDKITWDRTIQLNNYKSLHAENFDIEIDKAIEESMKKYEHFMCDKGVIATPDTSEKSSQTDAIVSKKIPLSCKRCLKFDDEDFTLPKRTKLKLYDENGKESNLLSSEQIGSSSLTELMLCKMKHNSKSNSTHINLNSFNTTCNNIEDDFTRPKNNVHQFISNDSSETVNQDMKDDVNIDNFYNQNCIGNDDFSLYDEDMNVDDELNWSKSKCKTALSDHEVPVVELEVTRTEGRKSPFSFTHATPKKPILKVGLSKSARVKPLHQK